MDLGSVASRSLWPSRGRTAVVLRVGKWRLGSSTCKGAGPGKCLRFGVVGPREVVLSPSLGVFKMTCNKTLSKLFQPHGCPCLEQEVGVETS